MTKPGPRSWKTNLPLILAVLLGCPCIGIVLAAGFSGSWVPNSRPRAMQSECKLNLTTLFTAEKVRQRGVTSQFSELQVTVERGNRYAYFLGDGPLEDRSREQASGTQEAQGVGVDTWKHRDLKPITLAQLPDEVARRVGVTGQCPFECEITIVCAGNIDKDSTLDIWSTSTRERIGPDGQKYAPGEPMQHLDDVQK